MGKKKEKRRLDKERKAAARKQKRIVAKFQSAVEVSEQAEKVAGELTPKILAGKDFTKTIVVKTRDGERYNIKVCPVSEGELFVLADKLGFSMDDLRKIDVKKPRNMRLIEELAVCGIKGDFKLEELREKLAFGQLSRVGLEVFTLSRLGEVQYEALKKFRSKR